MYYDGLNRGRCPADDKTMSSVTDGSLFITAHAGNLSDSMDQRNTGIVVCDRSMKKSTEEHCPETGEGSLGPETVETGKLKVVQSTYARDDSEIDSSSFEQKDGFGKESRRVRFHNPCSKDHVPVSSYHDAPDPWSQGGGFTPEELLASYKASCVVQKIKPSNKLLSQLQAVRDVGERFETLTLKGERLDRRHCDALEEVLKRVQFKTVDLEATDLDDDSSTAVFEMMEYYESAVRLVVAYNKSIGPRGWQACSRMMKMTPSLVHLDLRSCSLSEQSMPFIGRALRVGSQLHTLHLENTNLSGKLLLILVAALKLNTTLRELFLADNRLMPSDGIQLGNLLKHNRHLDLLDLRNNHLQDTGATHICEGLHEQTLTSGLLTLVLWNNHLTYHCMPSMALALTTVTCLETLNLGHNSLTNEGTFLLKEGLLKNRSLKRIGIQASKISCEGAIALAEFIADSKHLVRIDLRENDIKTAGLMALSLALKVNQSVQRLDVDKETKKEKGVKDYMEQQSSLLSDISNWLQRNREHARRTADHEAVSQNISEEKNVPEATTCMFAVSSDEQQSKQIKLASLCKLGNRAHSLDSPMFVPEESFREDIGLIPIPCQTSSTTNSMQLCQTLNDREKLSACTDERLPLCITSDPAHTLCENSRPLVPMLESMRLPPIPSDVCASESNEYGTSSLYNAEVDG